jgi:hypothetical protein
MKTKSFSPVGSLHPFLFFAVVYAIAILLSVFICSSLFYSCNASSVKASTIEQAPVKQQATATNTVAVAMR